MKKVLVLGGGGYLGSVLVPYLSRWYSVTVLDNLSFGIPPEKDDFIPISIGNIEAMSSIICQFDAVINLAAIVGADCCDAHLKQTWDTNIFATKSVIEMCYHKKTPRFIFASTDSVYGVQEGVVTEQTKKHPMSLYAESKSLIEEVLLDKIEKGFNSVILRMGTLFGLSRRMRFDLVVNQMVKDAFLYKKLTLFGGDQWRPLLHLLDAAEAYRYFLDSSLTGVYNVGSESNNVQIKTIVEKIVEIIPGLTISKVEATPDLRDYWVSPAKLESTGFKARHSISFGVTEVYSALKKGMFKNPEDRQYRND